MKPVMFLFPLILIVGSYLAYRLKFKISKETYDRIIKKLRECGQLHLNIENKKDKNG